MPGTKVAIPTVMFTQMAERDIYQKLLELLLLHGLKDSNILVTGAGQGELELLLRHNGFTPAQLHPVDIDPGNYRIPDMPCGYADLSASIPFGDESFDVCIASEVIEHLENPSRLVTEAHRVLRPAGHFILTTPNVHSVMQKARWLLKDRFGYFSDIDWRNHGHLHPIFDWLFRRMTHGLFEIIRYDAPSFHIRLFSGAPKIPVPWRNRFFSNINIYVCRKLNAPPRNNK
jgi:SAM-dependent methyltransferase